jgi:hypothetical protein
MPPFEKGNTVNLGKTPHAVKVARRLKKIEAKEAAQKAAMLAAVKPSDLMPLPDAPVKRRGNPAWVKGHPGFAGGGKRKLSIRTSSIKAKIHYELTKNHQTDTLDIARKLINMAKAGDLRAIEMIMERMDGKVPQAISGDKENPLIIQVEPIIAKKYSQPQTHVNAVPINNLPGHPPI